MPVSENRSRQGTTVSEVTNPFVVAVQRVDRRNLTKLMWSILGIATVTTTAVVTTAVVKAGEGRGTTFTGPGGLGIAITAKDDSKATTDATSIERLRVLIETINKSNDTSAIRERMRAYSSSHPDHRELETRIDKTEAAQKAMLAEALSIVIRLGDAHDSRSAGMQTGTSAAKLANR